MAGETKDNASEKDMIEHPKILHIIWESKDVPPSYIKDITVLASRAVASGYKIKLWVDDKRRLDRTLEKHFPEVEKIPGLEVVLLDELTKEGGVIDTEFTKEEARDLRRILTVEAHGSKSPGSLSDIQRELIILQEGGLYTDIDNRTENHSYLDRLSLGASDHNQYTGTNLILFSQQYKRDLSYNRNHVVGPKFLPLVEEIFDGLNLDTDKHMDIREHFDKLFELKIQAWAYELGNKPKEMDYMAARHVQEGLFIMKQLLANDTGYQEIISLFERIQSDTLSEEERDNLNEIIRGKISGSQAPELSEQDAQALTQVLIDSLFNKDESEEHKLLAINKYVLQMKGLSPDTFERLFRLDKSPDFLSQMLITLPPTFEMFSNDLQMDKENPYLLPTLSSKHGFLMSFAGRYRSEGINAIMSGTPGNEESKVAIRGIINGYNAIGHDSQGIPDGHGVIPTHLDQKRNPGDNYKLKTEYTYKIHEYRDIVPERKYEDLVSHLYADMHVGIGHDNAWFSKARRGRNREFFDTNNMSSPLTITYGKSFLTKSYRKQLQQLAGRPTTTIDIEQRSLENILTAINRAGANLHNDQLYFFQQSIGMDAQKLGIMDSMEDEILKAQDILNQIKPEIKEGQRLTKAQQHRYKLILSLQKTLNRISPSQIEIKELPVEPPKPTQSTPPESSSEHTFFAVLDTLPQDQRLDFAAKNQDKIYDDVQLAKVLDTLPQDQRLEIAIKHQDKIQYASDLAKVLDRLPQDQRLDFAAKNQYKIYDDVQLAKVLDTLPQDQRLEIAIKHQDKIQYASDLAKVLDRLPQDQRLKFAIKIQDKIQYVTELAMVLDTLPQDQRLEFAIKHQDKIEGYYDLLHVLKKLPEDQRLEFVIEHQDKIEDAPDLATVLDTLPQDQRLEFVIEHQDKIKDAPQLGNLLHKLPEDQQLKFATKHQDKIQDGYQLARVVYRLPQDQRLKFAIEHQDKIKDAPQLGDVLNELTQDQQLKFAIEYQDKIQDGYQLACLGYRLPEEQQLKFAIKHQDKIQDGDRLRYVLKALPKDQRLEFAIEHQDKIKDGFQLSHVLKELPEDKRLDFAVDNRDKIQDESQFAQVLNRLSKGDHDQFKRIYQEGSLGLR